MGALLWGIAFGAGYQTGLAKGRVALQIQIARDVDDSQQSRTAYRISYEPYFTRRNLILGESIGR